MSITITEIRNAISTNDDNTEFHLEINHPEYGWIDYILHTDDTDNTIDNAELLKLIGDNYTEMPDDEKTACMEKDNIVKRIRFAKENNRC